jgi:hypothetical protein
MAEKGNAYRILVGKAEGKRPLERPGRRWENNTNKISKHPAHSLISVFNATENCS